MLNLKEKIEVLARADTPGSTATRAAATEVDVSALPQGMISAQTKPASS